MSTPTVTLKNGNSFECKPGQSILDGALSAGLVLEYSCKSGQCGICEVGVDVGLEHIVAQNEVPKVSSMRVLTCCSGIDGPVGLDIKDLGMLADIEVKTGPCKIDSIARLTLDVVEVNLRVPPKTLLHYLSGQHIAITGPKGLVRSYSIANTPRDDGSLTLHIRKVSEGAMSNYWFNDAAVGDLLRFNGPLGTFYFREHDDAVSLILLATGTGYAPIKSILESIVANPSSNRFNFIYLIWGGREIDDLYETPSFSIPNLVFIPVLSREQPKNNEKSRYVQDVVIRHGIDLKTAVVYSCGSPEMISASRKLLISSGLDGGSFFSDAFVSSN